MPKRSASEGGAAEKRPRLKVPEGFGGAAAFLGGATNPTAGRTYDTADYGELYNEAHGAAAAAPAADGTPAAAAPAPAPAAAPAAAPAPAATQKTAVPVLAYKETVTLSGSTFKFTHPLASSEGIKYLISCAQTLIRNNPTGRVFSLGQSPAWIVKTASLIETSAVARELNTTPSRFNGIAYSGALFGEDYQWREPMPTITPAQKASYREYLQGLHLDPSSIIKSGKPVTIVEHTHSGKGLFSFLRFIQDWARGSEWESYKKLIKIHFLKSDTHHPLPTKISACFKHSVQIIKHKFITDLANADDFDDRLLPHYDTYVWGTLDAHPEFCKNLSASSKDIIAKIVLHLDDDFDHNHGHPPAPAAAPAPPPWDTVLERFFANGERVAPAVGGEETAEAVVNRLIKGLRIVPLETAEEDKPEEVRAHLVEETAAVVAAGSDPDQAPIDGLVTQMGLL